MKRVHVIVSGFVQGVGFRHETRRMANTFGLTGWVRNTEDGKVEAVFAGAKDKLDEIIAWCHKGPYLAEVERVDVAWEEAPPKGGGEFSSFEIR